jgi:hypothetical protein
MNVTEYKQAAENVGFIEYPKSLDKNAEIQLESFVSYKDSSIDLKIYIAEMLTCRCFATSWGIRMYENIKWFIGNFLNELDREPFRPWMTNTVRYAIDIVYRNVPAEVPVGTLFMFSVIEYSTKHVLGYRPKEFNIHEKEGEIASLAYFKKYEPRRNPEHHITLYPAFKQLMLQDLPLSHSLQRINGDTLEYLRLLHSTNEYQSIIERLAKHRNDMAHGTRQSYYAIGAYLVMLYTLFYFHYSTPSDGLSL